MKFKRLEVSGFKSFADKLQVKFGSGITGIVGPNGCGKSNVADAVRWVLGEQSAKLLRGSSMQDVIFNGTGKRKSLSFCEVSLVFDNSEDSDGTKLFANLEYKEVVISRKLYRSGESEYLLNKQTCRLKDITDLLREGHMGREGYSIIGQGRIEELLRAKPEDRRAIFEEAAGISKFKVKKVESERKLARTADNLDRLNDILKEKAAQLEPLTRQSQNARRWLGFRDQLRHHEINIYIHQYDTANDAKRVIGERLDTVLGELDARNKESESLTAEYNESMAALTHADTNIEKLREELLELTVGIEREAGEIKLLNERLGYLTEQSERIKTESEAARQEHQQSISFIEQGKTSVGVLQEELEVTRSLEAQISAEYLSVVEELVKGEAALDQRHHEVIEAMDRLADIKSNMGRLLAEKTGLERSIEDYNSRIVFIESKKAIDVAEVQKLTEAIETSTQNKTTLEAQRTTHNTAHNEALLIMKDCAEKLDTITASYHATKSRLKMFKEMQESNESFGASVKKLLRDAKENTNLSGRIEGVVAQLVRVKPGFEVAVATALGNSVQNIVTATEAEAKYLIAYLKEKRYGQVTFLPINSVKPRRLEPHFMQLLSSEEGVLGVGLDVLTFDHKYDSIMKSLLGGTVFVRDMDAAVNLAKKSRYGFRIVTLEGDIIQSSGSITGGSKKSELTNIFGYEHEIEKLTERVQQGDKEIAALTSLRDSKATIQSDSLKHMTAIAQQIHDLDIVLAAKNESLTAFKGSIAEQDATLAQLQAEMSACTVRVECIEKDINSVSHLENLVAGERAEASECDKEQRAKFDDLRMRRDALHEKATSAKMAVSGIENEIKNIESDIKRLQTSALILAERLEYNSGQLAENEEVSARIEIELKTFSGAQKSSDSDRVKEIRLQLSSLDERKQSMQTSVAKLDNRRGVLLEEIQTVLEKKSKEEQLLLKVDSDIEYMQARVLEEYELTYGACLAHKEHHYNATEGAEAAAKLKRQMQAIGHVNLESIELCKQVYEDYHAMNIQKDDLLKAKTDLEKIIADLSKEMLSRFTTHFETIRTNFVTIFRELFNGGTADLVLLESENPLEAGIDIVAQPPDKKLQTISLLSGGERALTAIAILFAILRLRPMPFCILDEIEAALDDANAGRFARYLRRFSQDTQFIVITHRKPTMELADSLYGVTMEEKGVSKIVSVKLSDAVTVAETQPA